MSRTASAPAERQPHQQSVHPDRRVAIHAVMRVELAERGSTVFSGILPGEIRIAVYCTGELAAMAGRVTALAPP